MNVRQEFQVHKLNKTGLTEAHKVAQGFSELLDLIESKVPACRELSLVKTHLEQACFYAKRGVAVQVANQERDDG